MELNNMTSTEQYRIINRLTTVWEELDELQQSLYQKERDQIIEAKVAVDKILKTLTTNDHYIE